LATTTSPRAPRWSSPRDETIKATTIEVKGDRNKEVDETSYRAPFGNSSSSPFTETRGVGTILNDD
jgi:hypothetical protein